MALDLAFALWVHAATTFSAVEGSVNGIEVGLQEVAPHITKSEAKA